MRIEIDEEFTFVVPPDWHRPLPPTEVQLDSDDLIELDGGDAVTIETEDEAGDRLPLSAAVGRHLPGSAPAVPPFDALAYYRPFHFYRGRWGIYLKASGILELVRRLVGRNFLYKGERWIVDFAAKSLLFHELFHYQTEVACSRLEYPLPTTLFGIDRYTTYFFDRAGSYVEEAVANSFTAANITEHYSKSTSSVRYGPVIMALLTAMDHQPEPYNKFRDFLGTIRLANGRDFLIDRMYEPWLLEKPRVSKILSSSLYYAELGRATHCPTYLVLDNKKIIYVAKPFPKERGLRVITHSRDHPPPHIHVEDVNRGVSTRYLWPDLRPYPGDEKLPRPMEERLKAYVERYRDQIAQRLHGIYGPLLTR
ncbi:MAG TPA: hypothetical protein VH684_24405 [Xanthobacteraceae bacterium]